MQQDGEFQNCGSGSDVKKLKQEIELLKNREIKYLIKISNLEKEAKKIKDLLEYSSNENKEL